MKSDHLNWRPVEEGLDDMEGDYYGLEEIDDVEVVKNGNEVILKLKEPKEPKEPKQPKEPKEPKKSKDSKKTPKQNDVEEEEKEEEFTGFDDDEDEIGDVGFGVLADAAPEDENLTKYGSWPANLNSRIYAGLKRLGFDTPTPIQSQSIPLILNGSDVIGKAETGSGKTLAYSLPLLHRYFAEPNNSRPEGLIISPTRELAHQIRDHLQAVVGPELGKRCIVAVTGGLAVQKQLRLLAKHPAVVVATPGRLLEVLQMMPLSQREAWQQIPSLVLDEADRLIRNGSFAELDSVMNIIGIKPERQVLVFSATFNPALWQNLASTKRTRALTVNSEISEEMKKMMVSKVGLNPHAEFVNIGGSTDNPKSSSGEVAEQVVQAVIECPPMKKDLYLYYFLYVYPGKTVVFVNSIDSVKRIAPLLKELKISAFGVHSDMAQKQRLRVMDNFRKHDNGVLVATDLAARGLDVPKVEHVVHYHLPRSADMYVHRCGRTARAGNSGASVVLCSPQEASGPLPKLLRLINARPQHLDVDFYLLGKLDERVKLAKQIADAELDRTKRGKSESWLAAAAEELGVDAPEEDVRGKGKNSKDADLRALRAELSRLCAQKTTANRKYLTSGTVNLAHELLKRPGGQKRRLLEELGSDARKKTKT